MKRYRSIILFLFLICFSMEAFSQKNDPDTFVLKRYDFCYFAPGWTSDEVRAAESHNCIFDTAGIIAYNTSFGTSDFQAWYIFQNDSLDQLLFVNSGTYSLPEGYELVFNKAGLWLQFHIGMADEIVDDWSSEQDSTDYADNRLEAIYLGKLTTYKRWNMEGYRILLVFRQLNGKLTVSIDARRED